MRKKEREREGERGRERERERERESVRMCARTRACGRYFIKIFSIAPRRYRRYR
jgi:hypothetical protein